MTGAVAARHSPLEGVAAAFAEVATVTDRTVSLAELPFLAQINLRADPADAPLLARLGAALGVDLPTIPNTAAAGPRGDRYVLWLGPDEWLVIDRAGTEASLEGRLRTALRGGRGSVVDVSANRTTIRLAGPAARAVLEHGCSIDLHPRAFGPGRCAQTLLARAGVILISVSAEPEYRILVRPSFAAYLATWLLDAVDGAT
ncbi:MAG: sarcosine oxidase, subunit gamma [Chloroflexota bacterium]|nr:sarcosine oxidase, subunit gamma [Chloroflexota bacterium]